MTEPPVPLEPAGRAGFVISQIYYYVAAVVGVGLLLGGLIAFLFGVRTLVLPQEFQTARDGIRDMVNALVFAIPGAVVLWWHLRETRRSEATPAPAVFWGRVLYFFLVSLVALGFVIGGSAVVLSAAADAAVPHCPGGVIFAEEGERAVTPVIVEEAPEIAPLEEARCYPTPAEAARQALDGAIFILAAGPVLWWHLRQGRRAVRGRDG